MILLKKYEIQWELVSIMIHLIISSISKAYHPKDGEVGGYKKVKEQVNEVMFNS